MIRKVMMKVLIKIMRKKGYSSYFAPKIIKETINDFKNTKNVNFRRKIWAYKKGFFSSNIVKYGLNDENYRDYMPDFDYYKLHPINGQFGKWIDDKMTLKYILREFNEYLPEYYFYLQKGKITKLIDCPEEYGNEVSSILNLLENKRNLAVKLIAGSLGEGFYKLSYKNKEYMINNEVVSLEYVVTFLSDLNNYTITEYLFSHKDIREIFPETANNLRVMLVNDETQKNPKITGSFIKFGTKKSGMIEHVWAGGIFCKVDLNTGNFSSARTMEDGEFVEVLKHPDTNTFLYGTIPYWSMIEEILLEISNYIPQVRYMGFDIIITDDSFKIIEINSHQGINLMQAFYPLMKCDYNTKFFKRLRNEKSEVIK